jgi:hypothetical protein
MAQYASLEEAFGGTWGSSKRKAAPLPREEDMHSSQKTYNSPTRRTEAAVTAHSSLIEATLKSLPIGDSDSNYAPALLSGPAHSSHNQIEPFTVTDYKPPAVPGTGDWSYASTPSSMGQTLHFDQKLDKMLRMMEGAGGETPSTHDLLLYIFTGVFTLFVLDSFVHLGKIARH